MIAGVPEGSVISPQLFNLYVDDIAELLPEGVFVAQFADDVALWTDSSCPRLVEWKLGEALKAIEKWTGRWRVELEPSKSSFILFSRCPTHRRLKISLRLHGIEIPQVKHARFLGIIFDEKLDWTQQINSLVGRTSSRIHLLRNIAAK